MQGQLDEKVVKCFKAMIRVPLARQFIVAVWIVLVCFVREHRSERHSEAWTFLNRQSKLTIHIDKSRYATVMYSDLLAWLASHSRSASLASSSVQSSPSLGMNNGF